MKQREIARVLYQKGQDDLAAAGTVLPFPAVKDAIVGFLCQQAAEKFLKSVLADAEIEYPRTHNIRALMTLLVGNGLPLPETLDDLDRLTPYAVEFRYDPLPPEGASTLDRAAALSLARTARDWAAAHLGETGA